MDDFAMESLIDYQFENIIEYDDEEEYEEATEKANNLGTTMYHVTKFVNDTNPIAAMITNASKAAIKADAKKFNEDFGNDLIEASHIFKSIIDRSVKSKEVQSVIKEVAESFKINPAQIKIEIKRDSKEKKLKVGETFIHVKFPDAKIAGYWGFMKRSPGLIFKAILKYIDTEWAKKYHGHSRIKIVSRQFISRTNKKDKVCMLWLKY